MGNMDLTDKLFKILKKAICQMLDTRSAFWEEKM